MRNYRYTTGREAYPEISEILAAEYGEMPAERVEAIIAQHFGEAVSPEDLEFSLGKALKAAGKVAQTVAPMVAPMAGTVVGTALGGPVGGAIGGQLGTMAGRAITPGKTAPLGRIPGKAAPPGALASAPTAVPAPAPIGQMSVGGGSVAAAQLLQLLFHPVVFQALMTMLVGGHGRPNLMVGNTPVPPGAVTNTIATLATQAAAEYNAVAPAGEAVPRYLLDESGEFLCDPAIPEERAVVLLERFNEAAFAEDWEFEAEDYADEEDLDAWYDEMDLIEMSAEDWRS
jgi:hypothetical protein